MGPSSSTSAFLMTGLFLPFRRSMTQRDVMGTPPHCHSEAGAKRFLTDAM